MNKLQKLYFLCKEIGIPQLTEYAVYQMAKKSGIVARNTPIGGQNPDFDLNDFKLTMPITAIERHTLAALKMDQSRLLNNAEEILNGFYHPFGGEKQPLSLTLKSVPAEHWTAYTDLVDGQDIKWIWEPARFSWAFDLARAFLIKADDRYVRFFWTKFYEFEECNPVNYGPNWVSAQEAAMRILTWTTVFQVFKDSPATTPENVQKLAAALWQHAARIPPTLAYARSQNNNHLLSEALGLVVAGAIFYEKSTIAKKWLRIGFKEFHHGLLSQIEPDGTYSQHSANYHRLMLQLSLIYFGYAKIYIETIPPEISKRLAAATRWLTAQLDPKSGRLPNLGHNDGTLLLPMGCEDYRDYRPTAQAASLAFLGETCLPPGQWDELSVWLGLPVQKGQGNLESASSSAAIHKLSCENYWVTLRGVQFHGRPAHADQLHLDFWWDGINIAQDAGTFSYNDPFPWQNPFTSSQVHNTISIDGKDQMQQAGKFLWLDHAQAKWLPAQETGSLCASHDGYRKIGVIHQRTVYLTNDLQLQVADHLRLKQRSQKHTVLLHWLLPDWEWKLDHQTLFLDHLDHRVQVNLSAKQIASNTELNADDLTIIRGGETQFGKRSHPLLGWVSDTYGLKQPALSLSASWQTDTDLVITTNWKCSILTAPREG